MSDSCGDSVVKAEIKEDANRQLPLNIVNQGVTEQEEKDATASLK